MVTEKMKNIISILTEINNDATVPKNVRDKITEIIETLKKEEELSIKIHKVLNELDEIAEDINLQPYTRTLIWNVASELERL